MEGGTHGGHSQQVVQGGRITTVAEVANGNQKVDLTLKWETMELEGGTAFPLHYNRNVLLKELGLALEHRNQPFVDEPPGDEVHNLRERSDGILLKHSGLKQKKKHLG
jgi:hypothetical protein